MDKGKIKKTTSYLLKITKMGIKITTKILDLIYKKFSKQKKVNSNYFK